MSRGVSSRLIIVTIAILTSIFCASPVFGLFEPIETPCVHGGSPDVVQLTYFDCIPVADGAGWFVLPEGEERVPYETFNVGYDKPTASENKESKEKFAEWILGLLDSSNPQKHTAGAFYIQSMLGKANNGEYYRERDLRSHQYIIDMWYNALVNDPKVYLKMRFSEWVYDAGYVDSSDGVFINDITYSSIDAGVPDALSLSVYRSNDTGTDKLIYAMAAVCGNSWDTTGFGWNITPTIEIYDSNGIKIASDGQTANVTVGDVIKWKHVLKNDGSYTVSQDIKYYYQNTQGWSSSKTLLDTIPKNTFKANTYAGGKFTGESTSPPYTVKASDAGNGKILCKVTIAEPQSPDDSSVTSGEACVKVGAVTPPTPSKCRPWVLDIDVPTDVHSGRLVNVNVTGTDVTNSSVAAKHWRTTNSKLDVTLDCTNGDVWNFHFATDSYVYYHYDSCDGGDYCHWVHHDLRKTNVWDLNAQGPCFDYSLAPTIKDLGVYQAEVNSTVIVSPLLENVSWTKKTHTKTKATDWKVVQLVVKPNAKVPTVAATKKSSAEPCPYYLSLGGISDCIVLKQGNVTLTTSNGIKSGSSPFGEMQVDTGDYEAGTKICYAFSTHAAESESGKDGVGGHDTFTLANTWSHSPLSEKIPCMIIVKKPKVQVWGGDLYVGRSITGASSYSNSDAVTTTTTKKNGGEIFTFGSWTEYGVFVSGSLKGLASGSAFAGSYGLKIANVYSSVCDFSRLTFTHTLDASGSKSLNTCTQQTVKGKYTSSGAMPDIEATFSSNGESIGLSAVAPSSLSTGEGTVYIGTKSGDLSISASNLTKGKTVIIKVHGTATITGDQKYENGPYRGVLELPQLVIIADNINIVGSVERIDAWLVARSGSINTCSDKASDADLTANDCSKQLIVNGPVIANKLYMRRTYGSLTKTQTGVPAEIFNLRADAYMWAFSRATGNGNIYPVYTYEVPPRL